MIAAVFSAPFFDRMSDEQFAEAVASIEERNDGNLKIGYVIDRKATRETGRIHWTKAEVWKAESTDG